MYEDYANQTPGAALQASVAQHIPPTARQQLERRRYALENELDRVDFALKALNDHPELEAFSEAIKAALR